MHEDFQANQSKLFYPKVQLKISPPTYFMFSRSSSRFLTATFEFQPFFCKLTLNLLIATVKVALNAYFTLKNNFIFDTYTKYNVKFDFDFQKLIYYCEWVTKSCICNSTFKLKYISKRRI